MTHATPRTKLAAGVACSSISDRSRCCSAVDGRTTGAYINQPCLPASRIFQVARGTSALLLVLVTLLITSSTTDTSDATDTIITTPTYLLLLQDGAVCQTAVYVSSFDPHASASCVEFVTPQVSYRGMAQEVQRITLQQATPARLRYNVTLTAIECPEGTDCIGTYGGTVQLGHAGKLSAALALSATAAQIGGARPLLITIIVII